MAIYDLYGSLSSDLNEAKELMESDLGVKFHLRESDYQGGEYFQWGATVGEHFVLKRNVDFNDNGVTEMSFPSYMILLYINDTHRSRELQEKILKGSGNFMLLRHEELD